MPYGANLRPQPAPQKKPLHIISHLKPTPGRPLALGVIRIAVSLTFHLIFFAAAAPKNACTATISGSYQTPDKNVFRIMYSENASIAI